jgi:hypothetical protein
MKRKIILCIITFVVIMAFQFITNKVYDNHFSISLDTASAVGQLNDDSYIQSKFIAKGGVRNIIFLFYVGVYALSSLIFTVIFLKDLIKTIRS